MANQVGLEIFEFVEAKAERSTDNFEYWKSGFIVAGILLIQLLKGCAKKFLKVEEDNGRKIWEVVPDKVIRIAFCEDPFGNIIEIYDRSYEQTIISLP